MTKIRLTISLIPENDSEKYRSDEKWFEQITTSEWLLDNNPDYFQKVIAAFNGVEWKRNEH
jgi:hypothetical protein